jgi:hypothetical protein
MHDIGNRELIFYTLPPVGVEYRASLSRGNAFISTPMPVELSPGLLWQRLRRFEGDISPVLIIQTEEQSSSIPRTTSGA